MTVHTFVKDVLQKPGDVVKGMACGLDNSTPGDKEKSIAWTTGYVAGELGPYSVIPITAYLLKEPALQYVASCMG